MYERNGVPERGSMRDGQNERKRVSDNGSVIESIGENERSRKRI